MHNVDSNSMNKVTEIETEVRPVVSSKELAELDEGFQFAMETEGVVLDPKKEKKLVRKFDWYILPMMCILMSCQLMDKSTASYASIMGLLEDLHMDTNKYAWVGSSFYLGYLFFLYPASMLLQRFPLGKTLSFAVVAWAVIICCHAATHSTATFLVCRTFLGIFESFMDPAYMLMTSQYYKTDEQYVRCAYWLGFQGIGTMLGSGIAYGFYTHEGSYSFTAWRLMYIVTGVITLFFGILSYVHVPDIPTKAWFLNEEEKVYTIERIRKNRTGFGSKTYKPHQLKEAILDPTFYLFFLYMFGYGISNGALGNFGSILLEDQFGFDTGQSLLMNMVGSGIDIIFPLAFAYVNRYLIPSRLLTGFIINSIVFIGLCMLAFAPNNNAKIFGYFATYLQTASWACMSPVISSNVVGHTKKITMNTAFLIGFCVGNLIGPQTFLESEAPVYFTAARAMVGTYVGTAISPLIMYYIYYTRNKKKDEEAKQDVELDNAKLSFGDMTDKENPAFRYIL